jgi:hypothetical protein
MNSNFILLIFLLVQPCAAQVASTEERLAQLLRTWQLDYGYFNQLKRFEKETTSSTYFQRMAHLNALYGNYESAITQFNRVRGYMLNSSDTIRFATYSKCQPVLSWLDSVSQNQQIIIVNESHHQPKHRAMTKEYLEVLYKNGFRYLALEALHNSDSLLHTRKYALATKSGLMEEPCYGDLARQALELGYSLVGYDTSAYEIETREMGQAQNIIQRVLKNQPDAKILIHCGFSHGLTEKGFPFSMMGYHLVRLSGITPFVINQQAYDENTEPLYEYGAYRYFESRFKFKEPVVFLNPANKVYRVSSDGDAAVFLPRSIYQNGRPHWLNLNHKKRPYPIDLSTVPLKPPFLVQAFLKKEGFDSIPVDQVEIHSLTEAKDLLLYPGTYLLVILDNQGTKISTNEINIIKE